MSLSSVQGILKQIADFGEIVDAFVYFPSRICISKLRLRVKRASLGGPFTLKVSLIFVCYALER